jgi:RecJ-like exonuclease
VFNLDRVGISAWEGHRTKKVIVLAAILAQTIHQGVSRNVRHISAIPCISAAGESLSPYIVGSSDASTIQEHLKKQAVLFGGDFTLIFDQKPSINTAIFRDDIRTVPLPSNDILRGLALFAQEVAVC